VVYELTHAVLFVAGSAVASVTSMLDRSIPVTQTKYAYQNAGNTKTHAHISSRFVRCFTCVLISPKLILIESTTNETIRQFGIFLLNTSAFPLHFSCFSNKIAKFQYEYRKSFYIFKRIGDRSFQKLQIACVIILIK
jgi:hypothetical protein